MSEMNKGSTRAPFAVLWALELWERFGFYGLQAILAVYFAKRLGFDDANAMLIFGSFSALLYGGPLIGGWIGDNYLGSKRTVAVGATILFLSYLCLSLSSLLSSATGVDSQSIVLYSLAGVAVGGGLFKPNPTSLISKLFRKGDPAQDSALTYYYMAINIGSFFSMLITPIIAAKYGYTHAFLVSAVGMFLGLLCYTVFYSKMSHIASEAGLRKFSFGKLLVVLVGCIIAIAIIGNILEKTQVCRVIITIVTIVAIVYFFVKMSQQNSYERKRMLVAFILIVQGVIFFVLYQQMPTSLNFFAINNVNGSFLGLTVQPEQWQVLNPLVIIIMSPILSVVYKKIPGTHITKFCIGMTLSALAFLILYFPQFTTTTGIVSGWWLVLSYWLQSTGELLISALGLSMVAELFPSKMGGFAQGMWQITTMVAGPIGGFVGALTAPAAGQHFTKLQSIAVYGHVFLVIGLVVVVVVVIMWAIRGWLNSVIDSTLDYVQTLHNPNEESVNLIK